MLRTSCDILHFHPKISFMFRTNSQAEKRCGVNFQSKYIYKCVNKHIRKNNLKEPEITKCVYDICM